MCDECGIRPATIRLMSIAEGEKIVRNLCAHCLADVKKTLPDLDLSGLDGVLASLIAATKKMGISSQPEINIICEHCGTTYEQFQKIGLLGCAGCYQAFHDELAALLGRIHGRTQHVGRRPGAHPAEVGQRVSVHALRQQLRRAIAEEDYEQAAVLRDRIKGLQAQREEVQQRDNT